MSFVGVDWSGTPDAVVGHGQEFYICCGVYMDTQEEEIDDALRHIRQELGLLATAELHGYGSSVPLRMRVLQLILERAQMVVLVLDKTEQEVDRNSPTQLPAATALWVLEQHLDARPVRRIWCDEDMSKERQRAFNTRVFRLVRRKGLSRVEVKHRPSHKSCGIQLADVAAYTVQREMLGALKDVEKRLMRALYSKAGNIVQQGSADDLRSYLP